ncbi:MAG: prohibitin family protein [bacterium]|nr:prohibitin family protein [bacterium]
MVPVLLFLLFLVIFIFSFIAYKKRVGRAFTSESGGLLWKISLALSLLFLVLSSTTIVPAGHVGVIDFVGHVYPRPLPSGLHLVNPFAKVIKMSIKTQEIKEDMTAPTLEGLTVNLEVSTIYHLDPEKAPEMYRTVGLQYVRILLEPNIRASVRDITASYNAQALYSPARGKLSKEIQERIMSTVGPRGIVIEEVPLRKLVLPQQLQEAIAAKLTAEQQSQQMQFILQKEEQEAERKRIEAKGIADFQQTVMKGIDRNFLIWKAIDASKELASSPNTKIVVFGGTEKSMPLIINPDK